VQTLVLLLAGLTPPVTAQGPPAEPTPPFEMPYDIDPYDYEALTPVNAETLNLADTLSGVPFVSGILKAMRTTWVMIEASVEEFASSSPLVMFPLIIVGLWIVFNLGNSMLKRLNTPTYVEYTPEEREAEPDAYDRGLQQYEQETYGRVWHEAGMELQRRKQEDIF